MQIPSVSLLSTSPLAQENAGAKPADAEKVPGQFEAILLRQFLSESMKPLLQEGPAGQVYGYLLTDSLAASVTSAGGLGLSSILQSQLGSVEDSSPKP